MWVTATTQLKTEEKRERRVIFYLCLSMASRASKHHGGLVTRKEDTKSEQTKRTRPSQCASTGEASTTHMMEPRVSVGRNYKKM
jgi:hypothetical protein